MDMQGVFSAHVDRVEVSKKVVELGHDVVSGFGG
jgi:hypothetical protein